jgi:hypothetical protein
MGKVRDGRAGPSTEQDTKRQNLLLGKAKTPTLEALQGLPLVGIEQGTKSSQKGVPAAGRFAPPPGSSLDENMLSRQIAHLTTVFTL